MMGRKPVFLAAILIFLAGSMLAGLSQTMTQLIGFRALQGIGAGGLLVGAQAIIADIVPPRQRGRYMGLIGSVFAVASVAGPLLGGFLVETFSWRWVFYVNVPIGALAVVVVVTRLHLHTPAIRHRIDYLGAGLLAGGVSALILVTTWGGSEYAWGSATILGLAAVGVVLLVLFVWRETRAEEPILPLSLFRSSVFSALATRQSVLLPRTCAAGRFRRLRQVRVATVTWTTRATPSTGLFGFCFATTSSRGATDSSPGVAGGGPPTSSHRIAQRRPGHATLPSTA
jgi:MFS family permease